MDQPIDLYEILGVEPSATTKDIKIAYRKLARQFHPDHNPDNPEAEKQFRIVTQAYEILRSERLRGSYDLKRASGEYDPHYSYAQDPMPPREPDTLAIHLRHLFENLQDGLHDEALHFMAMAGMVFYAVSLLAGTVHAGLPLLFACMIFSLLFLWLMWDEIVDSLGDPSAIHYNLAWLAVLFIVFNIAYYDYYQLLFGLQFSLTYRTGALVYGGFRFFIFIYWLAFYASGHWLFTASVLCMLLAVIKKEYAMAGWMLFGAQLVITSLIHNYPGLMADFVVFYQPLFTIEPAKPIL